MRIIWFTLAGVIVFSDLRVVVRFVVDTHVLQIVSIAGFARCLLLLSIPMFLGSYYLCVVVVADNFSLFKLILGHSVGAIAKRGTIFELLNTRPVLNFLAGSTVLVIVVLADNFTLFKLIL
ncbi:hypothetical protein AAVH_07201 [Aphelenchoides avenae]|nr:hypothetical protein AAVH_07201 [Aphelenchus avenae]